MKGPGGRGEVEVAVSSVVGKINILMLNLLVAPTDQISSYLFYSLNSA